MIKEEQLYYAIMRSNIDAIKALIKGDMGVNTLLYGKPLLFYAIKNKNDAVVQLLIELGADINAPDHIKNTPLFYAMEQNNIIIAKLLIDSGVGVNTPFQNKMLPLNYAISMEDVGMVQLLIDNKVDVNPLGANGMPPIYNVIIKNNIAIAKLLIDSGADVNTPFPDKILPLNLAIHIANRNEKSEEMVKLIAQHAGLKTLDAEGMPPIYSAICWGNERGSKLLIDAGANIDALCANGRSILSHAVATRDKSMVKLLIKLGANVDIKGPNDETFFQLICSQKLVEIAAACIAYNPKMLDNINEDFKGEDPDFYKSLKEALLGEYKEIFARSSVKLHKSAIEKYSDLTATKPLEIEGLVAAYALYKLPKTFGEKPFYCLKAQMAKILLPKLELLLKDSKEASEELGTKEAGSSVEVEIDVAPLAVQDDQDMCILAGIEEFFL